MDKKTIFSGVQPSGELTIGNYLGAIRNWTKLQDDYNCYFCIVDEHAITVQQNPADLRRRTLEVLALYVACGIDPEKSVIFIQSHVPEHAQLAWVLNSITYTGELGRMIQFKEKSKIHGDNVNAALYTYPVLMAADILLYNADLVPVGEDQRQHIEITRDIANRFNGRYSDTFVIPDIYIEESSARIMSLQDPSSKMSKSDENPNAYVSIIEDENVTSNKIKRAVTDSVGKVAYSDEQPAIKNLLSIYSAFTDEKIETIVKKYEGKGYGEFKEELALVVNDGLRPIRAKFKELMDDKLYLEEIYKNGAKKAQYSANKIMSKVYKKIGFVKYED